MMNKRGQATTIDDPATPRKLPVVVINPSRGWVSLRLRDLWEYRELLYFLAWRDIKVRYKQTVLGAAWAIIQPLSTMVVFSIFFGKLGKIPSDGLPYPIFAFVALLPWQLFSHSLTHSSQSLVGEARLITKVYFPRLIIPISSVLAGLVDFVVAFGILLVLMFYYNIVPTMNLIFLPVFILMAIFSALAVGLWLSALNVKYRDVRYTVPFHKHIERETHWEPDEQGHCESHTETHTQRHTYKERLKH